MVPLQVLWARVPQHKANATSLIAVIPIGLAALPIYYFRKGTPEVDLHLGLFLIIGSVVGAYVGARLLNRIPDRELKLGVAIVLLLIGAKELVFP
jgi:uncharacterized protein